MYRGNALLRAALPECPLAGVVHAARRLIASRQQSARQCRASPTRRSTSADMDIRHRPIVRPGRICNYPMTNGSSSKHGLAEAHAVAVPANIRTRNFERVTLVPAGRASCFPGHWLACRVGARRDIDPDDSSVLAAIVQTWEKRECHSTGVVTISCGCRKTRKWRVGSRNAMMASASVSRWMATFGPWFASYRRRRGCRSS
jgi:hypothetical protein